MAAYQFALDAQSATHAAHLVLEQGTKRLHNLQIHLFGQAAHIVVRLDFATRPVHTHALDHIGIDGALGEPTRTLNLLRLSVENVNESRTDGLALGFGVGNAFQFFEEQMARMNTYHIEAHFLIGIENFLKLVLAQEAIIDENAGQVPTNRLVEQNGSHGAVHTTRKAENDFVVAQLFFQTRHRVVDERVRGPVALAAANAECEVGQHLRAFLGVEHFGMELHRVGLLPFYLVGGVFHIVSRCDDSRARGQFGNRVAVTHPHLARLAHSLE